MGTRDFRRERWKERSHRTSKQSSGVGPVVDFSSIDHAVRALVMTGNPRKALYIHEAAHAAAATYLGGEVVAITIRNGEAVVHFNFGKMSRLRIAAVFMAGRAAEQAFCKKMLPKSKLVVDEAEAKRFCPGAKDRRDVEVMTRVMVREWEPIIYSLAFRLSKLPNRCTVQGEELSVLLRTCLHV